MYGKVFTSIYDGTLRDNWQALVTFQQMIVLADADGIVDMTPAALHHRTGIPLDIITAGLEHLAAPDAGSRTPDMEGRRIALIAPDVRAWGWFIVNHEQFRDRRDPDEVRAANRERKRAQRERSHLVTPGHTKSHAVTPGHAMSRHTDTDTYTDTDKDKEQGETPADVPPGARVVVRLPLRTRNRWHNVTAGAVDDLQARFPTVDVLAQVNAMRAWLDANPDRRKSTVGVARFITGWLTREAQRLADGGKGGKSTAAGDARRRADQDYLATNLPEGGDR